jgi:DNA invertase Pin-like site-specific DNA recombinase
MPSTSRVLDEARDLVTKRLAELDDERKRLERALAELGGKAARKAGRRAGRRPGRPKGSTSKTTSKKSTRAKKGTRRRKRRGGTRADQAVKLIQQNPGITASEIAKSMKIKPNYLYRVLSDLEKQKRVKKKGRTYSAAK